MATTLEQPATEQTKQDERLEVIRRDPGILGGRPCFPGTRVPVRTLFDVLLYDKPVDDFLEQFPTVSREQAMAVLAHCCGVLGLKATNSLEKRPDKTEREYLKRPPE